MMWWCCCDSQVMDVVLMVAVGGRYRHSRQLDLRYCCWSVSTFIHSCSSSGCSHTSSFLIKTWFIFKMSFCCFLTCMEFPAAVCLSVPQSSPDVQVGAVTERAVLNQHLTLKTHEETSGIQTGKNHFILPLVKPRVWMTVMSVCRCDWSWEQSTWSGVKHVLHVLMGDRIYVNIGTDFHWYITT